MFCSNCGKQLDENAKFCDGCGAQQGAVNNNANSASKQQAPNPEPNVNYQAAPAAAEPQAKKTPKKKNIIITAAVVLCAFIIGKFVIAPSMLSDSSSGSTVGNSGYVASSSSNSVSSSGYNADSTDNTVSSSDTQTQTNTNSSSTYSSSTTITTGSAYDDILSQAHIVHFPNIFGVGISTASFVQELEHGMIYCSDYGYQDDVIKQYVETLYVPLDNVDDSKKSQLESTFKAQYASLEALDCCTVSYKMGTSYFTVTATYTDVDKAENYSALYEVGVNTANAQISMSVTESGLIAQGAVKK